MSADLCNSNHPLLWFRQPAGEDWPSGSFRGFRARGGIEVDLSWQKHRLNECVLRSSLNTVFFLRSANRLEKISLAAGKPQRLDLSC